MDEFICFQEKKKVQVNSYFPECFQYHSYTKKRGNKSSDMFSVLLLNKTLISTLKPGTTFCYDVQRIVTHQ